MGDGNNPDSRDECLDGLGDGAVPGIELLNSIMQDAVDAGASSLSFVRHPRPTLSFQIRGSSITPERNQVEVGENYEGVVSYIKVLAGLNILEKGTSRTGFFDISINGQPWTVIVDVMPTETGDCLTLKLEPPRLQPLLFEDLGVTDEMLDAMRAVIDTRRGVVIVAGNSKDVAAGIEALCGLDVLAASSVACISYSGRIGSQDATRIAVGSETQLAPDAALREARRQDFGAIVLSEVFDMATAHLLFDGTAQPAFHAAGLITANACAVPTRLLDMGTPLFHLQDQLAGMLSFRLASRLCAACREQRDPNDAERRVIASASRGATGVFDAPGCDACDRSGIAGKVAVTEWIEMTDDLRASLDKGEDAVREAAFPEGEGSLLERGFDLVTGGDIAVREWVRVCGLA